MARVTKFLAFLSRNKPLKMMVILKTVLLVAVLLIYKDLIFVGDRSTQAQEKKPEDPKPQESKDQPKDQPKTDDDKKASEQPPSKDEQSKDQPKVQDESSKDKKAEPVKEGETKKDEPQKVETKDGDKKEVSTATEEKKDTDERKSFLDRLLNLPKLDPETIKKDELGKYLTMIEKKKLQVDSRIALLEKREQQLIAIEQSIDGKLKKLDEERKFLAETIQQEKQLKEERVKHLVEFYKKMEPKKAAAVFESLDKDLVVALFKMIPEKQIMSILQEMTAQKSVEITEYYGRIRSMQEYDLLREMNQSLRAEFEQCKGLPKEAH